MRRLTNDEGVSALLMALLLVPLIGFGAFVIDVGLVYWEVRQLQNGADAGALAVAQDCAAGEPCDVAAATPTAGQYTDANANDGHANAAVAFPTSNSVTVTASTRAPDGQPRLTYALAGVLEATFGSTFNATFARSATATWGAFGGGATIPLTFSKCEWDSMTGGSLENLPTGERTVYFHSSQTAASINSCGGPANQNHPGGFGWLDTNGPGCSAIVELGLVSTDTGNNVPSDCSEAFFQDLIGGDPVLLPIFGEIQNPQGSNADYVIVGFAALEVTGYKFSGSKYSEPSGDVPCSGNDRCIRGRFVEYYDLGEQPTAGAPDYGAYAISLTG